MNAGLKVILSSAALVLVASGCGAESNGNSVSGKVTVTITPSSAHPISPYIYGVNLASSIDGLPQGLTLDRAGGNRWTAYNWENNASNAGSDYQYENDSFLSSSSTPAEAVTSYISSDQKRGMATLITFQMQGWVAADVKGPVSVAHAPDLSRFKKVRSGAHV